MAFESTIPLWGVLVASAGVIALHLLSWRRPQPRWLPTSRFVPAAPLRAVSRRVQPSDPALLALRLLAFGALGLAVAGPIISLRKSGLARVIVADRSRAVANIAEVRDSVTALETGATATRLVVFDSLATTGSDGAWRDSSGRARRGDLDGALIVAVREAVALGMQFDSVELVVVSPLDAEEVTAATPGILGLHSGRLRLVPVASQPVDAPPALASAAWPPATDPVGAAVRLALGTMPSWLRVSRDPVTGEDSTHAAGGGLLLHWPAMKDVAPEADGVLSTSGAVVGSLGRTGTPDGSARAWWSDGLPAVTQEALGAGCIRRVAIGLPRGGDAVLRPAFLRLVRDLAVPCGWRDNRALTSVERAALSPGRSSAETQVPARTASALTRRLLLLLALLALGVEWWLRRRRVGPVRAATDNAALRGAGA